MTTQKYCKKCEQIVVYMPPTPIIGDAAIVFPIACASGNDPHLCKRIGQSAHDVFKCDYLMKKKPRKD